MEDLKKHKVCFYILFGFKSSVKEDIPNTVIDIWYLLHVKQLSLFIYLECEYLCNYLISGNTRQSADMFP